MARDSGSDKPSKRRWGKGGKPEEGPSEEELDWLADLRGARDERAVRPRQQRPPRLWPRSAEPTTPVARSGQRAPTPVARSRGARASQADARQPSRPPPAKPTPPGDAAAADRPRHRRRRPGQRRRLGRHPHSEPPPPARRQARSVLPPNPPSSAPGASPGRRFGLRRTPPAPPPMPPVPAASEPVGLGCRRRRSRHRPCIPAGPAGAAALAFESGATDHPGRARRADRSGLERLH